TRRSSDLGHGPGRGLHALAVPPSDLRRPGQGPPEGDRRSAPARDRRVRAAGPPGPADGRLSESVSRADGGLRRPADRPGDHRRGRPDGRALSEGGDVFDLTPAITEIFLIGVALVVLMLGVFKGKEPEASQLVSPVVIAALVVGIVLLT